MSSYYPSFTYKGLNSLKDKNFMVVAFDPNEGEFDTFLGMDCIYKDKYDGSRRLDYGAKFNSVAVIKISVAKMNRKDFTVVEVRDFLKWTTGAHQSSYLDLLIGDEIKFSFFGKVTKAYQQKLDARTIGLTIEFTSTSPWAYSPIQYSGYSLEQSVSIDNNGVVYKAGDTTNFNIDGSGVLYNNSLFDMSNDGTIYINGASALRIDNKTDDLYTPVYLNTVFTNGTSDSISIKNITLDEETIITGIKENEIITLDENQFILSDFTGKIFGDDFNFVWPRLAPGINDFAINGSGNGNIEFTYRYPIKIGDCAIDVDLLNSISCDGYSDDNISGDNTSTDNNISSGGGTISGSVSWNNITNKPTTLSGYGITNAYTKNEVDVKISEVECTCDGTENTNINEQELNKMLTDILG